MNDVTRLAVTEDVLNNSSLSESTFLIYSHISAYLTEIVFGIKIFDFPTISSVDLYSKMNKLV